MTPEIVLKDIAYVLLLYGAAFESLNWLFIPSGIVFLVSLVFGYRGKA